MPTYLDDNLDETFAGDTKKKPSILARMALPPVQFADSFNNPSLIQAAIANNAAARSSGIDYNNAADQQNRQTLAAQAASDKEKADLGKEKAILSYAAATKDVNPQSGITAQYGIPMDPSITKNMDSQLPDVRKSGIVQRMAAASKGNKPKGITTKYTAGNPMGSNIQYSIPSGADTSTLPPNVQKAIAFGKAGGSVEDIRNSAAGGSTVGVNGSGWQSSAAPATVTAMGKSFPLTNAQPNGDGTFTGSATDSHGITKTLHVDANGRILNAQ